MTSYYDFIDHDYDYSNNPYFRSLQKWLETEMAVCSGILHCEKDVQKVVHKKVKHQMENS